MEVICCKVVIVKHPNCNAPYTFKVPKNMRLDPGDYVLCKTKKSDVPQIARCITPSFEIMETHLKELYGILPQHLKPIVGVLHPVMYAYEEDDCDGEN